MRLLKRIAGLALAAVVTVFFLQKHAISTARQANAALLQEQAEAAQLVGENQSTSELREQNRQLEELRAANQELPKLRNEVRQLRSQGAQIERLRQENQRLASALNSLNSGKAKAFSEMEGYVSKESLSHAGFATPEAALQTFLWAVREGRIDAVAECISPDGRPSFQAEFTNKTEEEQKKSLQQGLGQLIRGSGYRVVDREQVGEDKVKLGIQAVVGGIIAKVVLRRVGNEWKFDYKEGAN
jgi:hypothetical protein